MRGHTLCWHSQTPDWLTTGTAAEVRTKLETYVRDVVTHFKGQGVLLGRGQRGAPATTPVAPTATKWYQILGADYIEIALRAARAPTPMPSSSSTTTAPKTPPSCHA